MIKKKFVIFLVLICIIAIISLLALSGCASNISISELSQYDIILSSYSSKEIISLGSQIKDLVYNESVKEPTVLCAYNEKESHDKEILVGNTDREESKQFFGKLRYGDYGYAVIDGKITVGGLTDEDTVKALELLLNDIKEKKTAGESFDSDTFVKIKGEYKTDNYKIGSLQAKSLAIIHPDNPLQCENVYAYWIAEAIGRISGYPVSVYAESDYEEGLRDSVILIGGVENTFGIEVPGKLSKDEICIVEGEKELYITSGSGYSLNFAVQHFLDEIKNGNENGIEAPSVRKTVFRDTRAMSFNILGYDTDISYRKNDVIEMILKYMPDSFGIQEGVPEWIEILEDELKIYMCVVDHKNGEDGTTNAVFFLSEKYTLLEKDTFWLSDNPNKVSHYGGSSYRTMTYATLRNAETGQIYTHVNTHLDTSNEDIRSAQTNVMLELTENIDGSIIITGDFNSTNSEMCYQSIMNKGFINSAEMAAETDSAFTYHGYDGIDGDVTIDYIFTNDAINILKYHVCNEKINGRFASDHHPLYIEFNVSD